MKSVVYIYIYFLLHTTAHIARYCTPLKTIKLQPNAAALFLSSARRLCGSEFVIVVAPRSRSMFGCARFFLSSSRSLVSRSKYGHWTLESHTQTNRAPFVEQVSPVDFVSVCNGNGVRV